ncbi:MAG: hypothetical protein CL693_15005 [Cellvibrionaceae bacterium]|nr:hypothetical protein [Cellvibrionaceae bacterium]
MPAYHLAQINIAQAKDQMESDVMKGFVERLDEINALAEASPGFIWRLQDESGNASEIQVFDDPLLLINMSVWQDIDSLKHYVYRSAHVDLLRDRDAWFNKTVQAHQALWWVPAGHLPSEREGVERLQHLQQHGPTATAFTFARPQPMPQN